jgi:hypothetical protein
MNIEQLSEAWVKTLTENIETKDENHWVVDYVIDLIYDEKYSELWQFIEHTYKKDISNKAIEALAAGPLEDLLAKAGEQYIERVEKLALKDSKFKHLLGGVWQNSTPDSIWQRVCNVRGQSW